MISYQGTVLVLLGIVVFIFSLYIESVVSKHIYIILIGKKDLFPIVVLLYDVIILLLLRLFIASFIFDGNFS